MKDCSTLSLKRKHGVKTLNCTRQLSRPCRNDVIIHTALVQFQGIYVKAVTVTVIKHLCESYQMSFH